MDDDDEVEHIIMEDEDKQPPSVRESNVIPAVVNDEERTKFKRIIIGIFVVGAMLTLIRGVELRRAIADFMAVYLVTFAAFKFSDIEAFAHMYRNYDWLAGHIRPWAYVLPFVQAFMGFWFLLTEGPVRLDVIALIISGTAAPSAIVAYRHHFKNQYAYHKTWLRLPFIKISMIESVTIFILSCVMLFLAISD